MALLLDTPTTKADPEGADRAAAGARANPSWRRAAVRLASLAAIAAAWWLASLVADPQVLPSPARVAALALGEARSGQLWHHVSATLLRVAAAFAVAMAVGGALGLLMGRRPAADRLLDGPVVFLLNVPALVVIVLAYLWIGLNEWAALAAVALNKIPLVAVTLREGARALDPALDEVGRLYPFGAVGRWRHVRGPQLAPFLAAAARNGLATIWKIVLVVEFLGRPNGVGFQIQLHFQLFDVGHVLVYALAFTAVMLAVEYALLQPWERRANRWRKP